MHMSRSDIPDNENLNNQTFLIYSFRHEKMSKEPTVKEKCKVQRMGWRQAAAYLPNITVDDIERMHREDLAKSNDIGINSDESLEDCSYEKLIAGKRRVLGSTHPRMNLFLHIETSIQGIDDLISYWKCLSGQVSYFFASENDNSILIGYYAESEQDAGCEVAKYREYLKTDQYELFYPYSRDDVSVDAFESMQNIYDEQVFYETDTGIEFWHKVVTNRGSGVMMPVTVELLIPELIMNANCE